MNIFKNIYFEEEETRILRETYDDIRFEVTNSDVEMTSTLANNNINNACFETPITEKKVNRNKANVNKTPEIRKKRKANNKSPVIEAAKN